MLKKSIFYVLLFALTLIGVNAQEDSPYVRYEVPAQNLLKYNRFLINPTFSTVREDKSYINLLHRNQSVQFDDNVQNYFLSYSGRVSDRTGLGLSLYNQNVGPLNNFGVLANYAYGIKLNEKSNFTFGANLAYYNSGINRNRIVTVEDDPFLDGFQSQNILMFQPGVNLSYGKFDVGVFAENLFDYNLKTSESLTEFGAKTFSGHLQYTHQFSNATGILEEGRLMPLARVRRNGELDDLTLGGSLILDLPKLGWVQAGYDSFYGAAAGVGFNLNRRISLGYTMEKGLSNDFDNFGVTHEISFAYSFTPNLSEDRVLLEDTEDELAFNEETPENITTNEEVVELKRKLAENDAIIAELMFRQDSLEATRQGDLERRFEMVMKMVRNETNGERPDLEKKAKDLFLGDDADIVIAAKRNNSNDGGQLAEINTKKNQTDVLTPKTNTPINTLSQGADAKQPNVITEPFIKRDAVAATDQPTKMVVPSVDAEQPNIQQVNTIKESSVKKDAVAFTNEPKTYETPKKVVQDKVKSRRFKDLPNVNDGYYVVANVYKGGQYLDKFINTLDDKGIKASYIDNPNNGLKYVYLERYDTFEEAVAAHNNQFNGKYAGPTWIMNVDNKYTNEAYASNSNKVKERATDYDTNKLRENVIQKDQVTATPKPLKNYNIKGAGSGYYLIANVFANPRNANRFVELLNSYGLSASYFINPENNYRYVYLKKHDSWTNALISYYTKLNQAYNEKMWIMKVSQGNMA